MAGPDRPTPGRLAVLEAVSSAPLRFNIFEALRWLEAAWPDKPRFGRALRLEDDPIRLRQEPSLGFAPTAVTQLERPEDGPVVLTQLFFGLWGPNGALPTHLTDYARQRLRNFKDPALARFADMFSHRMLELLYRAWADSRPVCHQDRPDDDRFTPWVGSLVGYGTEASLRRGDLADTTPLFFGGRFAVNQRNAEGLKACVEKYFGLRTVIEQWVPAWMSLTPEGYTRLGRPGPGARLGEGTVLGERVWSCQHRFRVVIGPTTLKRFKRFLPGQATLRRLVDLVNSYAGPEFDWELQVLLRPQEVPQLRLGQDSHLGLTTWLPQPDRSREVDDYKINAGRLRAVRDALPAAT